MQRRAEVCVPVERQHLTMYFSKQKLLYPVTGIHAVQIGSGVHPTSHPMGTGGGGEVKRPGREADQSPPTSA
jgi:hypothetical protein